MSGQQSIHLVGGVPLEADEVFDLAGTTFGAYAKRIPDGERKRGWLRPQAPIVGRAAGIIPGSTTKYLHMTNQRYRLDPNHDADTTDFGPLGYLSAALESYAAFKAARAAGKIQPGTRFQVSVPTSFGVMGHCMDTDQIRPVWPIYERQLFAELTAITDAIPHEDIAFQWDIALEITQVLDNPRGDAKDFSVGELADGVSRALDFLPARVEGGIHLCYGDAGEDKHYVNPRDMGVMVAFHNEIASRAKHGLAWVHMPVPKDREDDAYFAPLSEIRLRPETELILGLVHRLDGIDGARRKRDVARRYAPAFGIGTECGMGRYFKPETIPETFALHRELADLD
jgi:hypothetical protein